MPSPCRRHASRAPKTTCKLCPVRATALIPRPPSHILGATHVSAMCCRGAAVRRPRAAKARLLGASPSFVGIPFGFVPGLGAARVRCLVSLRASLLPAFFRTSIASLPTGFCCGAVSASLLVVSGLAFVFPSVPAGRSDPLASEARGGAGHVRRPLSFCPAFASSRSPKQSGRSVRCPLCGSSCLRRVQCRGAAFVGRLPARRHLFFVCDPAVSFEMRSPATPAHALRSLLVPALLLARGACSSSGCTSRLLRRPAFCFQDTPFCYAFGDAFRQLPQRLFARRGRRPVVPLSIPWLAVLGRGVPQAARQRSCGSQVPARALCRVACLMARPPRRRARHTLQALCCRLALRTPLRPLPFSLPCICGARRHAMRGPADDGCAAGPQAWARTRIAAGADPVTAPCGGRQSVAWRERKAARRCLGTVARAFAQGSARDRGGFRWPEGGARRMLAAALSQHRDAWRTTHTETASRKTPGAAGARTRER
ncbi:hypothetical protein ERJ75_000900700 [Trypanosoma vivax]|nr:hypothetical protein ERJ75_000900700 [Trypanosoma vivax]